MSRPNDATLLAKHHGLVVQLATQTARNYRLHEHHEELIAMGQEGLLQAARRYDGRANTKLSTYAYFRIHGAMIDGARAMGWIPPRMRAKQRAASVINEEQALRYDESAGETCDDLDTLAHELDSMVTDAAMVVLLADELDQHVIDDAPSPEDHAATRSTHSALRRAVDDLGEPGRTVLRMSFFEDRTLDEIASRLSCSRSWSSRLRRGALHDLRQRLPELRTGW